MSMRILFEPCPECKQIRFSKPIPDDSEFRPLMCRQCEDLSDPKEPVPLWSLWTLLDWCGIVILGALAIVFLLFIILMFATKFN